jgi:NAD-dependent deacetylase
MARAGDLPTPEAALARATALVLGARSVVALTGAGLSVESGIPPFRGPGGLWTKYGEPPMDGYQRFLRDPRRAWTERLHPSEPWAVALHRTLSEAKPNPGHEAFAALERLGRCDALITQNVDDLHRQAGSKRVLEIHGNHRLLRCIGCHRRFEPDALRIDEDALPPHCPACGGLVKGDTVHFGEPIPPDVLRACFEAVERADCLIAAGTSATVFPAADFPYEVLRRGGAVIEVNPCDTDLTPSATVALRGPGGAVLAALAAAVARGLEEAA